MAKYCNEHICLYVCLYVCLCVCVCVCLSVYPPAYFPNQERDLRNFFVYVDYRRARSISGEVTKSQGKGSFGVFFPIDNALYSIAFQFETHTKTAEPINMPFGLMTCVGLGTMR